jgi:transcriptional regulator GlxA family with amidase domain
MPLYRSGGQAQYVDVPVPRARGDEMSELLEWALPRIPTRLSVDDLARHASVSRRTLTRRFRQTTGLAPGEWLQRERLRLARRLLETSEDPIDRVARNAGYDTTVTMRAQFARDLHTSPRAYRRTFRATSA